MPQLTNREVVDRYLVALLGDQATLRALRHEQFVEEWPQSGERIRGAERMAQIDANYPGGLPTGRVERVVGSEDRWVTTPSFTVLRVTGTGDVFTALMRADYADGTTWYIVTFLELRDAKVVKATSVFAPQIEAPEWRAQWVERMT
jgi:hypothetical protein